MLPFPYKSDRHLLWFDEISIKDVPLVGGKNASLGEMYIKLKKAGVPIPYGFAITAKAYQYFLKENNLTEVINKALSKLKIDNITSLQDTGTTIRNLIAQAPMPKSLEDELELFYKKLSKKFGVEALDVAVRSSATAEDLPGASFAGQQETFLNVHGIEDLIAAVKQCFASLFNDRAISYRVDKGFDHMKTSLSVGVQQMVRSDLAASGIMFSIDPDTGFKDVVVINSTYGLGELIVQGEIIPDEFLIHKPTFQKGFKSIIKQNLGTKLKTMIYKEEGTKIIPTPEEKQHQFSITEKEALTLADWALKIEHHYQNSMDTEWAKDGKTGKLYIVQARPETVQSEKNRMVLEEYHTRDSGETLITGIAVGAKIGAGKVHIIKDTKQIKEFQEGEVLVTRITDPDWEPIMKIASAIVTDEGGRTSHAAIVSRELGIPCIVGTEDGTRKLKDGVEVTVDCSSGNTGTVYKGKLEFEIKSYQLKNLKKPKTKIMVNIASPEEAFKSSFLPNDGVGLAREEFIIASQIKIHPLALLHYDDQDEKTKKQIDIITKDYPNKIDFYVDTLASGIAQIGAAFYPNHVIVRFSDFKTNEYSQLIGGSQYEPHEENPMLGYRGASRYHDGPFAEAFKLECQAVQKVRDQFGLTNVVTMIPFCRTVDEAKKVLKTMSDAGLKQGKNGLLVYMMAEIPANIILADDFFRIVDGMSIGSNDLTQLVLGLDRDNGDFSSIGNEENEAVKRMIEVVVKAAKRHKKYIGICGQAPSDYPDFAQFLVRLGISSISLNPDTVIKTTLAILKQEKAL